MNRLRLLVAAAAMVAAVLPARVPVALAADPGSNPPQTLAQLNAQLASDQAKLNDLNNQVEQAQGAVDTINRKLAADKQRETDVGNQLAMMGKLEYEQPSMRLSVILDATSLQDLFSNVAQARLVANKQQNVLNQAHQLRHQDEQAHQDMAAHLATVQAARDQASNVAAATLALRNIAQDAASRALADKVAAQANATAAVPAVVRVGGPVSAPYPNHFSFGYCTYYVATRRYVPWFGNAIDWWPNARSYGYPEGSTPQVGAIMVSRESSIGHVAYVESVNGSTFTVSEMNWSGWDVVDRRTIQLGGSVPIVGFIYGQ